MQPWYIAIDRFGPSSEGWGKYVKWSGLTQLEELVSLDSMLCPPVLREIRDDYWPHIVNEDFMLDYFVDLDFLLGEMANAESQQWNLLCVFLDPTAPPQPPGGPIKWEALGSDLVDREGSASALTNCQGFPLSFDNGELSKYGLITSHERAVEIQRRLKSAYPNERHADCHVWAIFRASETSLKRAMA